MNQTQYAIRSLTEGFTDLTRYWSTYFKRPIQNETTKQDLPLHIEPNAWKGKFPAQVRVDLVGKLQRIKDAAYILGKAGVGLRQLASGLPGPIAPVQGKDVGDNLLGHFDLGGRHDHG